jgi:chromate transporter
METQTPQISTWQLFLIWASIGLQSFGGGASTTLLIQRAFIEKRNCMTMEEFTEFWSLCILTPGINLIGLTILIGKKSHGGLGILVSLAGLLLPSAAITCLLAALFQQVEHLTAIQAILKGVIPATGAIMLVVGLNFALPVIRKSYKEGIFSLLASSIIIVLCALAVILLKLSAIAVILGAIFLGALFFAPKSAPSPLQSEREGEQ